MRTTRAAARHAGRWLRAMVGPWRSLLGVSAAFALAWAGLVAMPHAPAAERWDRLASLAATGPVRQIVAATGEGSPVVYVLVGRWGIFISPDGGRNWLAPDRYLPRDRMGAMTAGPLALAPREPQFLLLAFDAAQAHGQPNLFKSVDGGQHWVPRRGLGSRVVEALAVAPDGVAYAAGANRHYRSVDGGDTWFEEGSRPTAARVLALASDGDVLYAGTQGDGLWVTADHGASWRSALAGHSVLALAAPGQGRAYAASDHGLYSSGDGGVSWREIGEPAMAGAVSALAVAPGPPDRLFVAVAGGLYSSPDGGATWQSLGRTFLRGSVTALAVDPSDPRRLFVGTSQGLWRCTLLQGPAGQVDHGNG